MRRVDKPVPATTRTNRPQSEPLCGRPWVRYWLHPEHLDLKRRQDVQEPRWGNVIGIDELLSHLSHDELVRWFILLTLSRQAAVPAGSCARRPSQGYARIKKLVSVLADKLRDSVADVALPTGLYVSQRPEVERVPAPASSVSARQYRAEEPRPSRPLHRAE